jgi:hypothetical protein
MPADLSEREQQYIGGVAQVLRRHGYEPVAPGFSGRGYASGYSLEFELTRVGPIKVYSYIALKRGEHEVARGDAEKSAIARLFQGEAAYREIFEASLQQFEGSLAPAGPTPGYNPGPGYDSGGGYNSGPAYGQPYNPAPTGG